MQERSASTLLLSRQKYVCHWSNQHLTSVVESNQQCKSVSHVQVLSEAVQDQKGDDNQLDWRVVHDERAADVPVAERTTRCLTAAIAAQQYSTFMLHLAVHHMRSASRQCPCLRKSVLSWILGRTPSLSNCC
jgi:hypothetical protein